MGSSPNDGDQCSPSDRHSSPFIREDSQPSLPLIEEYSQSSSLAVDDDSLPVSPLTEEGCRPVSPCIEENSNGAMNLAQKSIEVLRQKPTVPPELQCRKCSKLFKDPMFVDCCGITFCKRCLVRRAENDPSTKECCFVCALCASVLSPECLRRNQILREAVEKYESTLQSVTMNGGQAAVPTETSSTAACSSAVPDTAFIGQYDRAIGTPMTANSPPLGSPALATGTVEPVIMPTVHFSSASVPNVVATGTTQSDVYLAQPVPAGCSQLSSNTSTVAPSKPKLPSRNPMMELDARDKEAMDAAWDKLGSCDDTIDISMLLTNRRSVLRSVPEPSKKKSEGEDSRRRQRSRSRSSKSRKHSRSRSTSRRLHSPSRSRDGREDEKSRERHHDREPERKHEDPHRHHSRSRSTRRTADRDSREARETSKVKEERFLPQFGEKATSLDRNESLLSKRLSETTVSEAHDSHSAERPSKYDKYEESAKFDDAELKKPMKNSNVEMHRSEQKFSMKLRDEAPSSESSTKKYTSPDAYHSSDHKRERSQSSKREKKEKRKEKKEKKKKKKKRSKDSDSNDEEKHRRKEKKRKRDRKRRHERDGSYDDQLKRSK